MKRGVLITIVILALALAWCPIAAMAQQATSGGKASYKGVAGFYSQRFFPVGQAVNAAQVAAQAAGDEAAVEVADAGTTEVTEGVDVVDQVNDEVEVTDTDTTDTVLEAETQDVAAAGYPAVYNEADGTITYEVDGEQKTINIADLGLSAEWLQTLSENEGGIHSVVENEDGSVKLIIGSDDSGAKKWEYDPSQRLVAHYEGEAGNERCTMVTSDEVYNANYIWASDNAADPGAGPDGHQVVQRFNYDDSGNLETVDYFTWTAGDRQGVDKARYMYRQDTVVADDTTADDEVTAECDDTDCCEPKVTTKYFNDPFPVDWDPVLTGTVSKDEYGNYWLETSDGKYLLTARNDGFDADKDGSSGADEMNSVDWESLVGQEITVRGHQVNSDSEGGVYKDGEKADIFEVCDIITPEEKESLGDDYQATLDNMEAVANGVDPVNEGLTGDGQLGELGFINMFNGEMPQAGDFADTTDLLYNGFSNSGLASFYLNNIDADTLAAIREFATDALETALTAAEAAAQEAANAADDATDVAEAGTFEAAYDAEAGSISYNDAAGDQQTILIADLGWDADDLETVDTVNVTVNDDGQTTVTATLQDGTTLTATLAAADDAIDDEATDTTIDDDTTDNTTDTTINQNLEANTDVDALLARSQDEEWWRRVAE